MATVYNQYITKLIIQLLNEYGDYSSSDEKKSQRDTLTEKINEFKNKAQDFVNDDEYSNELKRIINESREEALVIAITAGISIGQFEKFCDCAVILIRHSKELFNDTELLNIKISDLVSNLDKDDAHAQLKFIYTLIKRILIEYNITKFKASALKYLGLNTMGLWAEFVKSYIPSINIDKEKANVLKDRIEHLNNTILPALKDSLTQKQMKSLLRTLLDQFRILLDDLRKTHGSKVPAITDGLSTATILYSTASMLISPKDGVSENIVIFLKDTLLPKITEEEFFQQTPKNELEAMLSCHFKRIACYLSGSVKTLTDGKIDATVLSSSDKSNIESMHEQDDLTDETNNSMPKDSQASTNFYSMGNNGPENNTTSNENENVEVKNDASMQPKKQKKKNKN